MLNLNSQNKNYKNKILSDVNKSPQSPHNLTKNHNNSKN